MGPSTRDVLLHGAVEVKGRMPWSSNGTFLVEACLAGVVETAVYKPRRGERPLWDFPDGLYQREVAAYELSEALGWGLVPLTVARPDGPLGEGSIQSFVPSDPSQHYFALYEDGRWHDQLRRICVFDLLANNTDRKGGHCLLGEDGRIWAIDNGLAFHAEFKLRTVIWDYAGQPIPDALLADVDALVAAGLPAALAGRLSPLERDALLTRARAVLRERTFPIDHSGHRYPWPLV